MTTIAHLLRNLGVTRCYKGYDQAIYCISLVVEDDWRLTAVTKELYIATAAKYNCKWTAVERNMRTLVARAWYTDRQLLCQLGGYPLHCEPTVSEFIEIIAYYVRCRKQDADDAAGAS